MDGFFGWNVIVMESDPITQSLVVVERSTSSTPKDNTISFTFLHFNFATFVVVFFCCCCWLELPSFTVNWVYFWLASSVFLYLYIFSQDLRVLQPQNLGDTNQEMNQDFGNMKSVDF